LWPRLFNISINNLHTGTEYTLSKFADNTNYEEWLITPDGCAVIQRDIDWLGNWAEKNFMKFHKGNAQSSIWRGIIPCTRTHRG